MAIGQGEATPEEALGRRYLGAEIDAGRERSRDAGIKPPLRRVRRRTRPGLIP